MLQSSPSHIFTGVEATPLICHIVWLKFQFCAVSPINLFLGDEYFLWKICYVWIANVLKGMLVWLNFCKIDVYLQYEIQLLFWYCYSVRVSQNLTGASYLFLQPVFTSSNSTKQKTLCNITKEIVKTPAVPF